MANEDSGEIVGIPVYVLLDEGSVVIPPGECRFVTPSQLPPEGNFFVITRNKLWCHKQTSLVKGISPVNEIGFLSKSDLSSHVQMNLPKIPGVIIARSARFFKEVYQKYQSESELMLLYNAATGEYDLWCPTQEVSHGSVEYKVEKEIINSEFKVVGTIHSHCDFGAFHSGTDTNDEIHRDGVHITIGHVNGERFSMVCSLVVNGNRCQIPCENAILGVSSKNREESQTENVIYVSSDNFYTVDEEEAQKITPYLEQIEKEWHPKVSKKSFQYYNNGVGFNGAEWAKKRRRKNKHVPWPL